MRLFKLKEYKKKTSSDVLVKPQTKLLIGNCLIGSLSCYARQVNFLYAYKKVWPNKAAEADSDIGPSSELYTNYEKCVFWAKAKKAK